MLRFNPSIENVNRHIKFDRWFIAFGCLAAFSLVFLHPSVNIRGITLMVVLILLQTGIAYKRYNVTRSVKEQWLEIHEDFLLLVHSIKDNKIYFKDIENVSRNFLNIEINLKNGDRSIIHDYESPDVILTELLKRIPIENKS